MSEVVLDASAVLALLNEETGSEEVARCLDRAAISAVNWAEVVAKLGEAGAPAATIAEILGFLNLEVVAFEQSQGFQAGLLRLSTRSLGLSLGDRACLALGMYLNRPVLTADRQWANLTLEIEVRLIR